MNAPVTAATGQMIMYSAGAGQQALDRLGSQDSEAHGVFTRVLIKELQAALLELKQMRAYVMQGVEQETLESAIQDNETRLAEIKRKVIQ